jgi:acetyl-CoA carboxylase biotin carboxyl carrier protein
MPKDKEDQSVFDVDKIREFIELMQEHELSEVDLKQADQRIRLRRGGAESPRCELCPAATRASRPGVHIF